MFVDLKRRGTLPKLTVVSNTTLKVNAAYCPVYVDELEMEDNSTIHVSGIDSWTLQSPQVSFGNGCKILARGLDKPRQAAQTKAVPEADQQKTGNDGIAVSGDKGDDGDAGVSMTFTWGIKSVGSLHIDASGGHGGDGGTGGVGQKGGGATCLGSDGRQGGRGGTGGSAGSGGEAGIIVVNWYPHKSGVINSGAFYDNVKKHLAEDLKPKAETTPLLNIPFPGLTASAFGGGRGAPGEGGPGGGGGDGVNCGLYSKGGGPPGGTGFRGIEGHDGATHPPQIALIPNPSA
jgi:hypothetical protein